MSGLGWADAVLVSNAGGPMVREEIAYQADGSRLVSYLVFEPEAGNGLPGVLVAPEGAGLGEHARERARRLAGLGYAAMALDLYGDGLPARDMDDSLERMRALRGEPTRLRQRARAGLDALASHPVVDPGRLAAIGFCFGGSAVLELARDGADLLGVVGFHCALDTKLPALSGKVKARVLACIGALDPLVTHEQRTAFEREMASAELDWQLIVHGRAKHSFTNPEAAASGWDALAYDRRTDERSWAAMQLFLAEVLCGEDGLNSAPGL